MFFELMSLCIVGLLWGGTNPLIKKYSKGIVKIKADNKIKQFILDLKYLITNVKYLLPMGLNQLGSVVYFLTLQHVELTLSVPIANSLTFVFTAISGWIVEGEQFPTKRTLLGIFFILFGTLLCCMDKLNKPLVIK